MLSTAPPCSHNHDRNACWVRDKAAMQLTSTILRAAPEVGLDQGSEHRVDPGVVDQHVEAAEHVEGGRHRGGLTLRIVRAPGNGNRVCGSAEFGLRSVQRLSLTAGDDDLGAFGH